MARVVKLGDLDQERLLNALLNPPVVEIGKYDWTITDVIDGREATTPFIFGNLAKYAKEGKVTVVDAASRQQIRALAPNLLEASAPFVYLPNFSGLAYLHVWNGIQENVFPRRFKSIIEAAYDNFFVGCHVEPVSDYQAFYTKLRSFDKFTELSAKVFPPNPLFGRLWENLHDYVKERSASEVSIREVSDKPKGIATKLVDLIGSIMNNKNYQPPSAPAITDAAILMAADGYGSGKAVGEEDGQVVIVRTSDTQRSFLHSKEPLPEELARLAHSHFARVSDERDMRH